MRPPCCSTPTASDARRHPRGFADAQEGDISLLYITCPRASFLNCTTARYRRPWHARCRARWSSSPTAAAAAARLRRWRIAAYRSFPQGVGASSPTAQVPRSSPALRWIRTTTAGLRRWRLQPRHRATVLARRRCAYRSSPVAGSGQLPHQLRREHHRERHGHGAGAGAVRRGGLEPQREPPRRPARRYGLRPADHLRRDRRLPFPPRALVSERGRGTGRISVPYVQNVQVWPEGDPLVLSADRAMSAAIAHEMTFLLQIYVKCLRKVLPCRNCPAFRESYKLAYFRNAYRVRGNLRFQRDRGETCRILFRRAPGGEAAGSWPQPGRSGR